MPRLITEWSTDDEAIARSLRLIDSEADHIVRLELEAALHTFQAGWCLREAATLRERQRASGVRQRGPYAKASCRGCRREVSVTDAGELRPHGPVRHRCPGIGGNCVACGQAVTNAWRATEDWRASHYCPGCLYGPLPFSP